MGGVRSNPYPCVVECFALVVHLFVGLPKILMSHWSTFELELD